MANISITPQSFAFTNINETTTIRVTTTDPNYTFERDTTYGDGELSYDKDTNTLTAVRYGRCRYAFVSGTDRAVITAHIERTTIANVADTKYVRLGKQQIIDYTPPDGYTLLHFEHISFEKPPVSSVDNNDLLVQGDYIGSVESEIVLSKNDSDDSIEYSGGKITFNCIQLNVDPDDTEIQLNVNSNYIINQLEMIVDNSGTRKELTIDNTYGLVNGCFNTKVVNNGTTSTDQNYTITINGVAAGEGIIKVKYNNYPIIEFNVNVVDVKSLTTEPKVDDNITIAYNDTYTIQNVKFDNNGTLTDIVLTSSQDAPFLTTKELQDPLVPNVHKVLVQATAVRGGSGTLTITGYGALEPKKVINIKALKQIVPTNPIFLPDDKYPELIVQGSYDYTYVYCENADKLEVVVEDTGICYASLENLKPTIDILQPDDSKVSFTFPVYSVYKSLHLVGVRKGTTKVTINAYVNDTDLVSSTDLEVNVLANDDLPDTSSVINLTVKGLTSEIEKDIIVNLPDKSSTLVLKEAIAKDLSIEFGYAYDYVEATDPLPTTNPKTVSANSGKATWLNTETNEVFNCIDTTTDFNKWKGSKGTTVGYIEYPNPGEKGFGVGPASKELATEYGLKELDGCWDVNSDNYGNYVDEDGIRFVFIPKHYIIPKSDSNLAGVFPNDGMSFEFSWEEKGVFNEKTIPRCFINNGKVQEGIFVSKYNGRSNLPNIYRTTGYPTTGTTGFKYYENNTHNPELMEMKYITTNDAGVVPDGYHNMTIFIQTMLANLNDLHNIACKEKGNENIKLEYKVSGVKVRRMKNVFNNDNNPTSELQMLSPSEQLNYGGGNLESVDYFNGPNTNDIKPKYRGLFSHNAQECGVFNVSGPINIGLPGVIVEQTSENSYEIYALRKEVDYPAIEKDSLSKLNSTSDLITIQNAAIFNTDNYELVKTINSNGDINGFKYIDQSNPYLTHNGITSLLIGGSDLDYTAINTATNINTLTDNSIGSYTETPMTDYDRFIKVDKNRDSVFFISHLASSETLKAANQNKWVGMFVSNWIPTSKEYDKDNKPVAGDFIVNGYRTRALRLIGSWRYDKLNGSKYLLSGRVCITPNK